MDLTKMKSLAHEARSSFVTLWIEEWWKTGQSFHTDPLQYWDKLQLHSRLQWTHTL